MSRLIFQIILTALLAILAFSSNLVAKEWMSRHVWYRPSIVIVIISIGIISIVTYVFDYKDKKNQKAETESLQKQLNNQTDELYNLRVITLSTNKKIDDLKMAGEQITGKGTQFEVKGVPPISEYFPLAFKSSLGLITGYVRVKGTNEFHRFSTKVNDRIPVVVHNLWLPDKKQYQSPPLLELVIDHQADEKATLSVYTTGYFLPDRM